MPQVQQLLAPVENGPVPGCRRYGIRPFAGEGIELLMADTKSVGPVTADPVRIRVVAVRHPVVRREGHVLDLRPRRTPGGIAEVFSQKLLADESPYSRRRDTKDRRRLGDRRISVGKQVASGDSSPGG